MLHFYLRHLLERLPHHLELLGRISRNTLCWLVIFRLIMDLLAGARILAQLEGDFLYDLAISMATSRGKILSSLFWQKILKFLLRLMLLLFISRSLGNHSSSDSFMILDSKTMGSLCFSNPNNLIFYQHRQMPHSAHHLRKQLYNRNDYDLSMYLNIFQF